MQPLVAWLVARPQNAVMVLAATLLLPVLQIFSGIFMVILVLKQGVRPAIFSGAMAAVGLTWEEAQAQCPEGVVPACHNAKDSVTISGDTDKVID